MHVRMRSKPSILRPKRRRKPSNEDDNSQCFEVICSVDARKFCDWHATYSVQEEVLEGTLESQPLGKVDHKLVSLLEKKCS